jgi:hypothetical protein
MREITDLIPLEHQTFLSDVLSYCQQGNVVSVTIGNDTEYKAAAEIGKELRFAEKSIEDKRVAAKAPVLEEGRRIDEEYNSVKDVVHNRVEVIASAIRDYQAREEARRIEEQRKADEEAERERQRITEEARKQREAESLALEEAEAVRVAAQRVEDATERQRLEAEAVSLERQAAASAEAAMDTEFAVEAIVAPVVITAMPKLSGVAKREKWKCEVTNKEAFIQYCISIGQYEYININMPALNRLVTNVKGTRDIPGVRMYTETTTTFSRSKIV